MLDKLLLPVDIINIVELIGVVKEHNNCSEIRCLEYMQITLKISHMAIAAISHVLFYRKYIF